MAAAGQEPADDAAGGSAAPRVVVCGAGIVGASAAFYLAERGLGSGCTLVERCSVASAASGRAAGFLALDWNDGSPLGPLSRKSYELHRELAAHFGEEKIGYRRIDTWFGMPPSGLQQQPPGGPAPAWLQRSAWPGDVQRAGSLDTTAQLHPRRLCEELVGAAQARGVRLRHGTVDGLRFESGRCVAVLVDGEALPCDMVVLAMGPWTERAREWLPPGALPPVAGLRRTSVVFKASLPPEGCLFHLGGEYSFYPRPDGTLYMSGVTEDPHESPLPEDSRHVGHNEEAARAIEGLGGMLCPEVRGAPVLCKQACYMPIAGNGLPLIGAVPGCGGSVLVGTGHGPWGILNGPATGLVLAELAAGDSPRSLDAQALAAFDPASYSKCA